MSMKKILASLGCVMAVASALPAMAAPEEITYLLPAPPNTVAFAFNSIVNVSLSFNKKKRID